MKIHFLSFSALKRQACAKNCVPTKSLWENKNFKANQKKKKFTHFEKFAFELIPFSFPSLLSFLVVFPKTEVRIVFSKKFYLPLIHKNDFLVYLQRRKIKTEKLAYIFLTNLKKNLKSKNNCHFETFESLKIRMESYFYVLNPVKLVF